jgi:flagellar biosynthesis component FlhA
MHWIIHVIMIVMGLVAAIACSAISGKIGDCSTHGSVKTYKQVLLYIGIIPGSVVAAVGSITGFFRLKEWWGKKKKIASKEKAERKRKKEDAAQKKKDEARKKKDEERAKQHAKDEAVLERERKAEVRKKIEAQEKIIDDTKATAKQRVAAEKKRQKLFKQLKKPTPPMFGPWGPPDDDE